MKTRAEIEGDIRSRNPRIEIRAGEYVSTGQPDYEEKIAEWVEFEFGEQEDLEFRLWLETLNERLIAEFRRLPDPKREKWYRSALKTAVADALKDGEIRVAREMIANEVMILDAEESEVRGAILAIFAEAGF